MYPNDRDPMSSRDEREKSTYDQSDYSDEQEILPSGSPVNITRYSDGSSTVNWGGPCGSTNYDANGEEC